MEQAQSHGAARSSTDFLTALWLCAGSCCSPATGRFPHCSLVQQEVREQLGNQHRARDQQDPDHSQRTVRELALGFPAFPGFLSLS